MIQPNELRIGNWVNRWFTGGNGPVKVHAGIIKEHEAGAFMFKYDPIPLTPEILEKAGFVSIHEDIYKLQSLCVVLTKDRRNLTTWSDGIATSIIDGPMYSVHSLQNLYFALTGTELNINL